VRALVGVVCVSIDRSVSVDECRAVSESSFFAVRGLRLRTPRAQYPSCWPAGLFLCVFVCAPPPVRQHRQQGQQGQHRHPDRRPWGRLMCRRCGPPARGLVLIEGAVCVWGLNTAGAARNTQRTDNTIIIIIIIIIEGQASCSANYNTAWIDHTQTTHTTPHTHTQWLGRTGCRPTTTRTS
jgi:hypothetical protein